MIAILLKSILKEHDNSMLHWNAGMWHNGRWMAAQVSLSWKNNCTLSSGTLICISFSVFGYSTVPRQSTRRDGKGLLECGQVSLSKILTAVLRSFQEFWHVIVL